MHFTLPIQQTDARAITTLTHQLSDRFLAPLPGSHAHLQLSSNPRLYVDRPTQTYRQSAVLALLYPVDCQWYMALMKRSEDGRAHSGQISFPGGKAEESDINLTHTALREAQEELGIDPGLVTVLGHLSQLYIASSQYLVRPVVGIASDRPLFDPSPVEVAALIEAPLSTLLHPQTRVWADVKTSQGIPLQVPAFRVQEHIVWGATAMILNELLMVWQELDLLASFQHPG